MSYFPHAVIIPFDKIMCKNMRNTPSIITHLANLHTLRFFFFYFRFCFMDFCSCVFQHQSEKLNRKCSVIANAPPPLFSALSL